MRDEFSFRLRCICAYETLVKIPRVILDKELRICPVGESWVRLGKGIL